MSENGTFGLDNGTFGLDNRTKTSSVFKLSDFGQAGRSVGRSDQTERSVCSVQKARPFMLKRGS